MGTVRPKLDYILSCRNRVNPSKIQTCTQIRLTLPEFTQEKASIFVSILLNLAIARSTHVVSPMNQIRPSWTRMPDKFQEEPYDQLIRLD